MINLELIDGEIHKFILPEGREQQLYDIWVKHNNKQITFNINGESLSIKLSEISDCYIGEKAKQENNKSFDNYADLNVLKDFLGIK
jgi:hypothetical protein